MNRLNGFCIIPLTLIRIRQHFQYRKIGLAQPLSLGEEPIAVAFGQEITAVKMNCLSQEPGTIRLLRRLGLENRIFEFENIQGKRNITAPSQVSLVNDQELSTGG